MNTVQFISKGVNTIANGILGNAKTKRLAQQTMLEMMLVACRQYQNDESFRNWIERVGGHENRKLNDIRS